MTERLSNASLAALSAGVLRPPYDRAACCIGVVHFGPGAFHRAHGATYLDDLLAQDPRWAICEVSLRTSGLCDALAPQDGLYTVAELDRQTRFRVIGAVAECLVGYERPGAVFDRLASTDVRLVTLTVTEKGYCLTAGGDLDVEHSDVRRDLATPERPGSVIGWLVEGLRRRRAAGDGGLTVLSCDNLSANGANLRQAVVQLAREQGGDLAGWIADACRFPDGMVDSITPATDDALRFRVEGALGVRDAWPVQREAFRQWVVEDALLPGGPDLASVGVTVTDDVGGWERAKLRLLNGAHSTLAYVGLLRGHGTVADAMADAELAGLVRRLMLEEAAPSLAPVAGLNVASYAEAVLERFRNPAIRHQLAQIAWDGSQKLPIRLLGSLAAAGAAGRRVDGLATAAAAWMRFIVRQAKAGANIVDPLAPTLVDVGRACSGDPREDVGRFLGLARVFPAALANDERVSAAMQQAYARLPRLA